MSNILQCIVAASSQKNGQTEKWVVANARNFGYGYFMANALHTLHLLRDAVGGKRPLIEALEYPGIQKWKSKWDSLEQSAKDGHIVQRHGFKFRALCAMHGVDVSEDVFLTERQRKNRAAAMAAE